MAVTKLSNSGIKTGVLKYDSMLAGNAAYDPAATWLIQRTSPTSGSSVTFSSIPSTYQSLQIRALVNGTYTSSAISGTLSIRLNGDSGSNYTQHSLTGNGATASATGATADNKALAIQCVPYGSSFTNFFGGAIIDIHDYASTTRNKTIRAFGGADGNGSGNIDLDSSLWLNTAAVSSITVFISSVLTFSSGTTFALYGMKG